MAKTANNHFISQFYQRPWEIADPKRERWIGVYHRDGSYREVAIKHNGSQVDFYDEDLEVWFKKIESKAGKVFAKVLSGHPIELKDRELIAEFFSTQVRRNPLGFERTRAFMKEQLERTIAKTLTEIDAGIDSCTADSVINRESVRAQKHEEVLGVYSRLKRGIPQEIFTQVTTVRLRMQEHISKMHWTFVTPEPDSSLEFVTSDNPAILPREGLVNHPNFLFPMGPKVCLVGRPGANTPDGGFTTISDKRVKRMNRRIISSAWEQVYASAPFLSKETVAKRIATRVWFEPE